MELDSSLKIICLQSEAFYALVNNVVDRIKEEQGFKNQKVWISDIEAMEMLGIKSKTTMQKLRDMGSIRFSQPMKKVILYDRQSIMNFLEKHSNETF